jgi:hypothetical protein
MEILTKHAAGCVLLIDKSVILINIGTSECSRHAEQKRKESFDQQFLHKLI